MSGKERMVNDSADGRATNRQQGEARPRKARQQRVMVVDRTERLAPHLVRVHLGGADVAPFIDEADPERLAATDKYVKMLFAKPELGLTPPYDLEVLRETLPREDLPVRRTYTVRSIDVEAQTIAIDFVVHGGEGIAGPWAASARPGDRVCLSGPGGKFTPAQDAAVPRLVLGDESAIPAIGAALEAMPAAARGLALIEVGDAADKLDLVHPKGVELRWLHRDGAEYGSELLRAVRELPKPVVLPEVFAHGERSAMKRLRAILHDDWGIERRALSLSAYWALGRAEDGFQAEKREPVGKVFDE